MEGIGTRDENLIRLVVSRSEIDLENLKEKFEILYAKTLTKAVESETSSDYKKCMTSVIDGNQQ